MKKINYMAPEMEVIELQINTALLDISMGGESPDVHNTFPDGFDPYSGGGTD